jgi:hypothetical protein
VYATVLFQTSREYVLPSDCGSSDTRCPLGLQFSHIYGNLSVVILKICSHQFCFCLSILSVKLMFR